MSWNLGIDIGGTFTDITAVNDRGEVVLWKEDSTQPDPELGVQQGLLSLAEQLGTTLDDLLSGTRVLVHGSTIGTNTVIQRNGPCLGLLHTIGFRDVLLFRDGFKWDRLNNHLARPRDFVDRYRRLGVRERIAHDGTVLEPLDEASALEAARELRRRGAEAIAVSLLWASVNPVHERRIKELLLEEMPGVLVVLSSDVLPEIGEWVRTSATVLSAYVYHGNARYLRELNGWLRDHGMTGEMLIMQVNGGCSTVERSIDVPVGMLMSGPAAGPAAAAHAGRRVRTRDMILMDMGGTSFDVTLIRDGEASVSRQIQLEHQPIGVQAIEVHSIGAGGGSLAWVDAGGALRVGPQSAGARPGPAAYGQGGERPTVTDANIVLGYIGTEAFLGGRRALDADRARRAIQEHVADPLGLDALAAAASVAAIVNANMVDAIRVVTSRRGIDPRPLVLVAGGGAGAVHAARLAASLGIGRVLVPAEAGTICAFGMTVTDVRNDYSATVPTSSADPALVGVRAALARLEHLARSELLASGFAAESIRLKRSVDARYEGQFYDLTVAVPPGELDEDAMKVVADTFHAAHQERYTWSMKERRVEYLHWRLTGIGLIDSPTVKVMTDLEPCSPEGALVGSRLAHFEESGGPVDADVFDRGLLRDGATIRGPALIDSSTTTIVIPPGHSSVADSQGNLLLGVPQQPDARTNPMGNGS